MSLFSILFGKKDTDTKSKSLSNANEGAQLHMRGKPEKNGLYPSELVMLAVAEKYKTTETNFPKYLNYTYEISNPLKTLNNLNSRRFLEIESPKDALPSLQLTELKGIASSLGIAIKGKKADIVSSLSDINDEVLEEFVKERKWKLTELGQTTLKANQYIKYFLEKHPYDVGTVGIDVWTVNESLADYPKSLYRDIIYRQINNKMNEASLMLYKNNGTGASAAHTYCECYRLMSLFIEEEDKSYNHASDLYFQYLYKTINIESGLKFLTMYKYQSTSNAKEETIKQYYDEIRLCPFQRAELLRLIDKLDINVNTIREKMIDSFKRADDKGIMTEKETADFIIFELNGELDKSKDLATKLAKRAAKKI